jgi:hypothetical protein
MVRALAACEMLLVLSGSPARSAIHKTDLATISFPNLPLRAVISSQIVVIANIWARTHLLDRGRGNSVDV